MGMATGFARALLSNPALVLGARNIFLLSHMRANTSLFGHLLGSHPLVEGYYEMHIGYFGWKSLWRQKLLHFADHTPKPTARWMFDKVLHDGHEVAPSVLHRATTRAIFMLRSPAQTLPSLITLYRAEHPDKPEATAEGAVRYYTERLATLETVSRVTGPHHFYLDAECLITETERTLGELARWLQFDAPIPREYQPFERTGRSGAGDTSARLKSGRVEAGTRSYSQVSVPSDLLQAAQSAYERCRGQLVATSACSVCNADALAPNG